MSALSDYIKARRESQFGTAQDMENYITASNGSWYHGKNTGSSAIGDLANVFGGSALASMGDFITGLGTLNKDMAGNDELDYLNPLRQSLYGEDTANELNRIRALGREATAGSTIKAGQKLSDYGSDMVADHTKQGKAPDGKTWGEMDFTDRVLNSDYWTDPYGIGNDLAVMGGSLAGQAPIMAAIPGGAVGGAIARGVPNVAKGLLGNLGKRAASKVFTPGIDKAIGYANSRRIYNAGGKLGELGGKLGDKLGKSSETLGSMANWAVRSAPTTALTNAGGIYSDLKEQGYSDSEIAQAMRNMMVDEIPQDFVTGAMTGLALSGKLGRVGLGKAGKKASRLRQGVQNFAINAPLDVTSEYFDEANQQRLQNKYTNKAYGEDIFHLTDDERAAGATAAAPALIPGLAGGARNTVLRGRSLKEAYNDYRKARSAKAVSNTIADTNREITNSVANANAWLDDNGSAGVINAPTTQTAQTAPTGGETMNAVSAAEPFMGQRMDNGENGCVEAVTKIGANGGNEFLANELKNGVVGVPKLVEDAGDKVVPFDENNVSEGDLIVYGDNDHVVMADGKGGYVGNSSSQQKVVQGDNYMDMGGLKPTKIIKTGGMSAPVADGGTNNADNSIGSYSGNADIDSMIDSAAKKYNLPPALLAALAEQESGFNPNAQSGMGAVGIMQLMPETAEEMGVDPNNVAENIEGGAKYLRKMLDMYDGDMEKALAAYNAGPGKMEEAGNDISKLSEETQNYVPSVMEKYRKFGGGDSVNTGSNTDTEWNIEADDVFGNMDNDFADTAIDDFLATAINDDTYAFPGLENLLTHAAEDGYVNRKELANEGLEQFEQYLTDLLKGSDTDIARMAGQVATNRKDGHALNLITGALNSNNTPVIKQIADSYRKPIIRLLTNIGRVRKNAEQSENVGDSVPVNQNTTGVPKQQNEGSLADRIAEQQNRAGSTNLNVSTPDYLVSHDSSQSGTDGRAKKILRDIHDKRISDVQAQQMAAQAQISQEQAIAMAKASDDENRRIAQAQALKSMAQANNVEIPQAMQPGLDAGAKKAIEAVQNLVAPTLEGEENNETESTEKTTPEEGIDTENKVQHTESEQGNEKAEVAVDNAEIETGTFRTEDGRTKYSVVIRKKLDKKKLKKLAKKHNGNSSNFEQRYAFSEESDRDGFVADVNAEFFGKDTQADTAGKTKKTTNKGGDNSEKALTTEENIAKGTQAMEQVIANHEDVHNAMNVEGIGNIDFVWGTPGTGTKLKKGYGVAHIIAKRDSDYKNGRSGVDGETTARKLVEVIAKGTDRELQGSDNDNSDMRIRIHYDGYTALLTKKKDANTWLLSGWEDDVTGNKKEAPVSAGREGYDSTTATAGTPTLTRRTRETSASVTSNVAENGDKGKENADDDFHGFLDDKKPGQIREIKQKLLARVDIFGGAPKGIMTVKKLMESMAKGNAHGEKRGKYYYIKGERISKAAYLYFEYLKGIGYGKDDKANETAKTTGTDDVTKNTAGDNKKTTSEGGVTLADGYRTESGKPLNEADKDEFVLKSDGSKEFGEISKDISDTIKEQTGITLNPGKIYLKVGNEKQGLIHAKKHESQAVEDGYNSIEDMIADVVTNFDQIYMRDSSGEDGHPTYSLVKHGNKNAGRMNNVSPVYFEIQDDGNGGYYVVITAMPMGDKTLRRNITKKDRLIYSNPGLDVATHSNDGAVFRDGENVGAGAHGGFPTSDKSNGLVTSNVTETSEEGKKKSWIDIYFPDDLEDKPGDSQQKREWHKLYNALRSIALKIERAEALGGLPDINYIKSLYRKYRDNEGMVSDARLDTVAKNHYKLVLDAREDKKKELEKAGESKQDNAADNNSIFGDVDESDIDELIKSMGFTPAKGDEKTVVAPEGISNTAEERERLEKALMAELNKLSINPVFNPKIYTLGLQLGFTYVKDGYNTAKKWLAKMHMTFGDKIEPWAAAIWNTIESYPSEIPFNEQTVSIATRIVGSMYEKGNTDLEQITQTITKKMTADQKKVFVPITEAAYNGVRIFFDNMKEAENNGGKQRESGGTAGGREGVQAGTSETSEEGRNRPTGVSGEVSGQGGRERTGNSESTDGEDSGRTEPGREGTGGEQGKNDGMGDSERGREQPSEVSPAKTVIQNQPAGNYEIKKSAEGKTSDDERFKQNIKAIKLLKKLESEDRMPTAAEQKVLAAYNGWGGLKSAFIDKKMNNELREILTEEEYESALRTINDAFYTSPDIIRAIWKGVSRLGFKGGRVLDPSMGIGNFFGCMPRDMMDNSALHGIEVDDLTTRLAKKLYPNANIEHKGFQDSKAPNDYYDLVISNIPFGTRKIQGYNIHNYFFANGIDKVRPGGLMVFITSQGALTNGSDGAKMRSYLAERADMVAAFKLPGGSFKEAGTVVVADVVIMRKRDEDGKPSPHAQNFISVGEYKEDGYRGHGVKLNDYFKEHPEHVLGKIYRAYTQYGYSAGVKPTDGVTAGKALSKAVNSLPKDIYAPVDRKDSETFDTVKTVNTISNEEGTRMFEYYEKDGKLYQNVGDRSEEVTGDKKVGRIRGILKIKAAMNELIAAQYNPDLSEKEINKLRDRLNKVYDTYVKKYSYLHGTDSRKAFEDDPSSGMILALERPTYVKKQSVDKNGKKSTRRVLVNAEKADIFSKRIIAPIKEVTKAETPEDALLFSLSNTGRVDLGYMAKLLNSNPSDVAESLKGRIYKNPATGTYETADEYLSGNVRQKLAVAELEAANNDEYRENVEALKKVMPEDLVPSEILVNIGSPWIPETDIQEYVDRIAGPNGKIVVGYSPTLAKWSVKEGYVPRAKFSAEGISLGDILECILNNRPVNVYTGRGETRELSQKLTDAANIVADDIRNDFREWLWSDRERAKRLARYYNDNYNSTVERQYDGSHLTFPGMNPGIRLDKHQKDVVWRTLQKGNTLIAHCVGAGKTFSMQAAGMEMRRLGIARKPLYALPNNVVEQFVREFRQLYPNAKILKLTNADLPEIEGKGKKKTKAQILKDRATRTKTLTRIQTEDWDAIVVSHTLFERLPVSPETAKEHIEEELKTLELAIGEQNPETFGKRQLSNLVQRKGSLEEKLKQQLNTDTKNIGITFEQLGIDQLFVDEADMFKNLQFTTGMDRVAGITNPQNVNRASDMFMKTQWLTNRMGGRGVVFATGTPISNTMAEMFTMMRYMDMKGLKEKGLNLFDRWCATFAEIGSGIERKPTGDGFRKVNRVKRFINMADLTKMFRKFADVKTQADLNLDIPKLKNGKPTIVAIDSDPKLTDYIKNVVPQRVANMKKGFNKQKGEDNMLALTNDLRKMSINDDKIEACADMVAAKFEETNDIKGAQLVFCDIGIPKAEKDKTSDNEDDSVDNAGEAENEAVYTKLMKALLDRGIPENQIGFIQSAKSKEKADEMFQKVDSGELRILIGSTQRMGAGTNCQHHLVALHDLDAPWRPRDLEQRHGRILRRGNLNKEVEIFNYVVKGSFDANMWEKLKNKAAIIAQAMSGDTGIRAVEDADLVTLGYAELEGAATDNPLIRERLELNNKVTKYANAQTVFEKKQKKAVRIVDEYPGQIGALKELVGRIKKDIADRTDTKGDKFKAVIGGKTYTERAKADEALQKILAVFTKKVATEIGEIGGLKIHALYEEKKYTVGGNTAKETGGNIHLTLVGNRAYPVNTSTIRGIEGTLQTKPEQMLKDTESDLKNREDELEGAKEIVGKEYPHKEELKEMQDRLSEIDRRIEEELVDRGSDEKKQDSKYSITDKANIADEMSAEQFESEVRKAFPTAENFKNDGSEISFTLPNGSSVTVNLADHIAMAKDKAGRDYGRNISDNEVAEGSYGGVGRDGFIELAKGSTPGTIFHEAYHFAKATALNDREKAFLKKRYKNEEEEAEAYRKWRLAKDRTGMFGKIWRKVQEIAEKMAGVLGIETKGHIFRSIESGEVYNRTANEQTSFEKKYSILTNDNSNEGFAQRIKNRFAGVLSHKKETENYRQTAMELLSDLTQCKIAWGKLDPELGAVYKKLCGVIRVAKPYDFARLMPAVGEAIAERLELNPTGEMSHYIADWIMTGAVNNGTAEAKEFARAMKANAYMSDKLLEVQGLFMKHFDEMSEDFHQKMISFRKPNKDKGVKDWFSDFAEKLYTDCVEELYPVDKLIKQIEAKTGEKFSEMNNPYIWYRMYRGWYGKAEALVEGNGKGDMEALQQMYPNVSFEGFKSLKTILQQVGAVKDRAVREAFSEYCVAKHVLDIHRHNLDIENEISENAEKIGKLEREDGSKTKIQKLKKKNQQLEEEWMETPYTADECEKIISESLEKYPAFEKGQKDLVRYSNRLVAILYDSGMISAKQANNIVGKWKNYVPMFREFEESEEIEFGDSMKAQTGSKRKVIDPLQSIIRNTYTTIQKSERNRCRLALANVCRCSDVGEYIEFVDKKGSPDMNDTVVVYYRGKRKYLVTDPSVARAVNGMDRVDRNTLLQIIRWPVKLARLCFVTINPAFAVRNVIRDGADAAIYSKYGFNPKDFVSGLIHSIARDDMYWKWIAAGGGQSSRISLDRDYTQSAVDRLTKNRSGHWILRRFYDVLTKAGEYSEYATRIGVFEKNMRNFQTKEGRTARDSIISAAFMSRDLIDFARGGRYSRGLNKISLFANASIQGWDKFFRTFDPRDRKSFMRAVAKLTFTVMIPALTIALMFRGDDWWEELPDWMKENNWCFKLGDTIIRIPKGQDVATRFFSNGIEKLISKKGKMNADLLNPLYDALPSLVPFGIVPIFEVVANYNSFTKGKVVPGYLERLPGDKQYNSSTSVLAKYLGEKTGYSPIKIDHLITGFTGNVGRGVGEFLNWIGRDKHSMPNITDLPIVNGVTYMPYKQPASVTRFYDKWDDMQKEHTLYKQTGRARNGYSESEYKRMNAVNKVLQDLAKEERKIVENQNLSNSERYDRQMAIQQKRMREVQKLNLE